MIRVSALDDLLPAGTLSAGLDPPHPTATRP